jgi:cytochrome c-type biogenesis protein CcmE
MTGAVRNRLVAGAALLAAGGALAFVAFGNLGKNLVFYYSPSEMLGKGAQAYKKTIRLGGIVKQDTVQWDASHTRVQFRIADNKEPAAASVAVVSDQVPPQMFREGIGVVVEGAYDKNQIFTADRLMVNHSNEYRPPKPGEQPHDWKNTIREETTSTARVP